VSIRNPFAESPLKKGKLRDLVTKRSRWTRICSEENSMEYTVTDAPATRNAKPRTEGSGRRLRRSGPLRPKSQEWQAFEEMFLASRSKFIRMAYKILRNREDAEDAVQDALLSAYVHWDRFEGRSAIRTWFNRVVLNASLMIRRKRKPTRFESIPESASADHTSSMDMIPESRLDPEMCCAETEKFALVDALIRELSPTLRQAFRMAYFDEMPAQRAGAQLGVSTATFKTRLWRAKKHLKHLAQRAVPLASKAKLHRSLHNRAQFQDLAAVTAEVWS